MDSGTFLPWKLRQLYEIRSTKYDDYIYVLRFNSIHFDGSIQLRNNRMSQHWRSTALELAGGDPCTEFNRRLELNRRIELK